MTDSGPIVAKTVEFSLLKFIYSEKAFIDQRSHILVMFKK